MSFTVVAVATSVVGLVLGIGWVFGGSLLLRRWGMEPHADGLLAGRRLGAAYLGIAVMLFWGRSAAPSEEAPRLLQSVTAVKGRYRWLAPPSFEGCRTIVDVVHADDLPRTARAWAEDAWRAWAPYRDEVRAWYAALRR